ncbi:homeodomain-only protein [Elysia marginata]|uniref:Homeodomain-only protein n=1 Tax=Elysia marginata TaxID=1093978 RepID=A0AAV4I0I6_9GAST|nr:homeodomain-only protein [Elysia marginata]
MNNSRSPTSRGAGDFPTSPYYERRSPYEGLASPAQQNAFTYDDRSPTSPYYPRSPSSANDTSFSPHSPNDSSFLATPGNGRSLSSSSNGSTTSTGLSGIQAHLSPPSQLPRVTEYQLKSLEANFKDNRNPSDLDLTLISAEVGLPESEVKHWFAHRLARWRQQQGLPANSTSVND